MKFTICLASLICLLLVDHSEQQGTGPIGWEIAKLQYFQAKLAAIKQKMVTDIQFISQLEQAILQAVIDALRRLQNMRTAIRSTGTTKETTEEMKQLFEHCEDLIRKFEAIEREKVAASERLNLAPEKDAAEMTGQATAQRRN